MSQFIDIESSLQNLSPCKFVDPESATEHTMTLTYNNKKFSITNLFESKFDEYRIVKYKKITDKRIIGHYSRILKVNLQNSFLLQITVMKQSSLFSRKSKFLLEICRNDMENQGMYLLNIFFLHHQYIQIEQIDRYYK